MMILEVISAAWANGERASVNLVLRAEPWGVVEYHATPYDDQARGRELFARAVAGDFGPIAEYITPVKPAAQRIAETNAAARKTLAELDALSVCHLREFIVKRFANDPALVAELIDYESKAQLERAKIK